ncbi:MAG: ribose 5-phosphate isomerase B [Candidatus Gracilibacteria bacterium]|jgi:ribose 5-phosphate isomerase B
MIGEIEKIIVYVGSDHAGFNEKESIKKFLDGKGYKTIDLGCFDEQKCDYPDIAREVSEKVIESASAGFGILICGTGIGMAMAANKLKGIRAALCKDENDAEMARKHNNANILTLGARTMDESTREKVTMKFLNTEFEGNFEGGERHLKRVKKMDEMDKKK